MALNFPLSPSDGDTYENYVYDATEGVWNANPRQLASRFITSATQPSTPSNGDGWLDTNTGKTYIYYNDGSSAQWIESGNPVIGFVDPYDQDSTSTGYFSLPKGTTAQRPVAPSNGDIRFNTTSATPEWYSEEYNTWINFSQVPEIEVEYLVIAGGAGGGGDDLNNQTGGGGGAGGYRCSVSGENSGGGASAESSLTLAKGVYTVTVGAGGAGSTDKDIAGSNGSDSTFSSIPSVGGGGGGSRNYGTPSATGQDGGSGGGAGQQDSGTSPPYYGDGTPNQGYRGGNGAVDAAPLGGAGGGGAGAVGGDATVNIGGAGGTGVASSITGSSVTRAGGGGGAAGTTGGAGGAGGGGAGVGSGKGAGGAGTVNTGSGGGGGAAGGGGAGGSGVVILKMPSWASPTFSVGLVEANGGSGQTIGDYTIYTITAGDGTMTI